MRIYEVVTEYSRGKDRFTIHDRFRIACQTFAEALDYTERKIKKSKRLMIQSIEIVADTEL